MDVIGTCYLCDWLSVSSCPWILAFMPLCAASDVCLVHRGVITVLHSSRRRPERCRLTSDGVRSVPVRILWAPKNQVQLPGWPDGAWTRENPPSARPVSCSDLLGSSTLTVGQP